MTNQGGFDLCAHELLNKTIAFAALLAPDGTVRDVSENALTAAGVSLSDVQHLPFWRGYWFSHDGKLQERIRRSIAAAAAGETTRFDFSARLANDERLHVDFQIAPVQDAEGSIVELLASGSDITEREQTKARLELALRDSDHRIKNIFSTVRALARMTKHHSPPEQALDNFLGRFEALASAHRVLSSADRSGHTTFETLVRAVLKPYVQEDAERSFSISGSPRLLLRDRAKLLALCLHELTTNAVKYGALSSVGGKITVSLSDFDAEGRVSFSWYEEFDTPVLPSSRTGFGTKFLEMSFQDIFGTNPQLELAPDRLTLTVLGAPAQLYERENDYEHQDRASSCHDHRG
ncbi:MAG TPA: hypothetical protein DD444_03245 [Citreicella sp.]|jgi:PAS domain S-box-containing protein|nr:hypothetical protein [Citreicella sp.]|tara:strand:+ start:27 stop:1073 length:1047 start_codon:yes stop_codon:yes gene_type:complete